MTTNQLKEQFYDDDFFYEDEEDEDIWDEVDWEDSAFPEKIANEYPGWYCAKITNFNGFKLTELDHWLNQNVTYGAFKRVGWNSGCSYSVGVVFESHKDAMMFRLRWA